MLTEFQKQKLLEISHALQRLSECERDAGRYRLWRKHYHSEFALRIEADRTISLEFLPGRPMVEIAGQDYEKKVDAAIDAAIAGVKV